jgi:phospholipase D1/2
MELNSSLEAAQVSGDGKLRTADLVKVLGVLLALVAASLAWRFTPISEWVNFNAVIAWQESVKSHPAALAWVVGAYLLGSLVLFPVVILNLATIFTFGPILGNAYSMAGLLSSAAMGYGIGRSVGRNLLRKVTSPRLHRFLQRAEDHEMATVLTVRVFPVAPFSIVNLLVGASRIRFWIFLLGSAIGRIPGIIVLALVGIQFENLLHRPKISSLVLLGLILLLIPLATAWLSKRI